MAYAEFVWLGIVFCHVIFANARFPGVSKKTTRALYIARGFFCSAGIPIYESGSERFSTGKAERKMALDLILLFGLIVREVGSPAWLRIIRRVLLKCFCDRLVAALGKDIILIYGRDSLIDFSCVVLTPPGTRRSTVRIVRKTNRPISLRPWAAEAGLIRFDFVGQWEKSLWLYLREDR